MNLKEQFKHIHYKNEKVRFLLFAFLLFVVFFLARYLLGMAYARYEVRAKINANIEKALYIFEDEKIQFNLEPEGIIPSDSDYVYKFSVANFNASKRSDVDLEYTLKVRTTTNLPIHIRMYRNESHDAAGATNLFEEGAKIEKDEDGAWYRLYEAKGTYEMDFDSKVTDIYTMVIEFPSVYAANADYANSIESIEIILESKQII